MAKSDSLIRHSSFFIELTGFILVHAVFLDLKSHEKRAFWMPMSVFSSVKHPSGSLSLYEKLLGHPLPPAPLIIDSASLPELAEEIAGSYFINPDTLKIKKLLALGNDAL